MGPAKTFAHHRSARSSRHVSASCAHLCHACPVSFDVYFQGFVGGESSERGGSQMREVLAPHVVEEDGSLLRIRVGDGDADVYLRDDGMMANHVSGEAPWDLLVKGAQAADWVIMPVGCPTCVTRQAQRGELPVGLEDGVVVVETGAALRAVIEAS